MDRRLVVRASPSPVVAAERREVEVITMTCRQCGLHQWAELPLSRFGDRLRTRDEVAALRTASVPSLPLTPSTGCRWAWRAPDGSLIQRDSLLLLLVATFTSAARSWWKRRPAPSLSAALGKHRAARNRRRL